MKIAINTEILKKYNLSIGEFLVLLMGYCGEDYEYMSLLRNFILKATKDDGKTTVNSLFMTIIENNRENENNN